MWQPLGKRASSRVTQHLTRNSQHAGVLVEEGNTLQGPCLAWCQLPTMTHLLNASEYGGVVGMARHAVPIECEHLQHRKHALT